MSTSYHQGEPAVDVKDRVVYAHCEPYAPLVEKLPDEVVQCVYESCRGDFWNLAGDEAFQFGYGGAYAEGRSGGWLHVYNPPEESTWENEERWRRFEANIMGLMKTARVRFLQRLKEELGAD